VYPLLTEDRIRANIAILEESKEVIARGEPVYLQGTTFKAPLTTELIDDEIAGLESQLAAIDTP